MSDIFDEREDLKNIMSIVGHLRQHYAAKVIPRSGEFHTMAHTQLGINWPGDELVSQIIHDALKLMEYHHLTIQDINF
jgi:hypothetical protein